MDTNAILLSLQLVLPAFNDFAQKAQLDMPLPLELSRTTKTNVGRNNRGVLMVFDDRYQFNWHSSSEATGGINFYDRKWASPSMDREKMLPWLATQKSLIGTNEAVVIASNCLQRLGYNRPEWIKFPPSVSQFTFSPDKKPSVFPLPLFVVRWFPANPPKNFEGYAFEIEVSGITKQVTQFGQLYLPMAPVNLLDFTNIVVKKADPAK